MLKQEQISPMQVGTLMLGFLIGARIVLPMAVEANQDAWVAALIGGAAGLVMLLVYVSTAQYYPNQSLIGYSKILLGRWLGGLVGFLYLWFSLHLGALVLRNFGDFLTTTILVDTPMSVTMVVMMLLAAYGVRLGLEPLARSSQVITPLVVFQVLLILLLLLKESKMERLLPVLENGLGPIMPVAFQSLTFPFGGAVLFGMILPHMTPQPSKRRALFMAMTAAVLLFTLITAGSVVVLGTHMVGTARYASLSVAQMVDVADFLNRLDALVVASWICTGLIQLSVTLWVVSRGLAEWVHLADYRSLVLPLGALMVALATLVYENISEQTTFAVVSWPVYAAQFEVLLPLLLWGMALLRGPRSESGR